MSDGSIRITIGAAADRSIESVFAGIEKRAQKAGQNINKAFGSGFNAAGGGGGGTGRGFDSAAAAARKAEREIEREMANQVKATKAAAREMKAEHDKTAKDWVKSDREASRKIIDQFKEITSARKQELKKQEADAAASSKANSRFAQNFGMYGVRNVGKAIGFAGRVAGDVMRGAGVDMSVAGSVGRAVQMESGSAYLANQERIATGSTRGSASWNQMSRDVGKKYSVQGNDVQEMVSRFTAKTGNFDGAAALTDKLTSLGVASGANLRDMGDAAGQVYNQLKNLPDAASRTIAVFRGVIGQSAIGAIDMPDYAKDIGRIASNASLFEGKVEDNIREQSALAQLSFEGGGARSAADAARSVASFDNTFGKQARMKAFAANDIDLYTNKDQNVLKSPMKIIEEAIRATKGNIPKMANMFADTLGRKPVTALANAYRLAKSQANERGASGNVAEEEGIKAVKASFKKYMDATLTEDVEKKNVEDYQKTTAAKAIQFQNSLDEIVNTTAKDVVPALKDLAPFATMAAKALGGIASAAAENPVGAIVAGLGLAIAKSAAQATIRAGFEEMIKKGTMEVIPQLGRLGLELGALAVVAGLAYMAYQKILDDVEGRNKESNKRGTADGDVGNESGKVRDRANNTPSSIRDPESVAADEKYLTEINANLGERIKRAKSLTAGDYGDSSDTTGTGGGGDYSSRLDPGLFDSQELVQTKQDAKILTMLEKQMDSNKQSLDKLRMGVQRVFIENLPTDLGGSSADPSGRDRDPGKPRTNWVTR